MSINKKALTRYLAYDRCLQYHGRKWSWSNLKDEANKALAEEGLEGIGKTQFYADMQYMELSEWKAPIERFKEGRNVFFRYAETGYTISSKPLSETEANHLKSAIHVLSRFTGMPQFEWMNEIVPVLKTKLGLVTNDKEVISFDSNADYEGLVNITPIFNAIINKRVLKITYQDFKSPIAYEVDFHPYYLKQFNNRWFAFGYNPANKLSNWNLALDRIKHVEETKSKYISNEIDWDDYFSDFVGVTKEKGKSIEIKLLIVDEQQAAYIKTKPLHLSQKKLKQVEHGFETSINVIPNYELEKLILSFGERIKILSPKTFQKKIVERIKKLHLLYK